MAYKNITPPAGGKITIAQGKLVVPDRPIIPFIRGDGTGPDIWAASQRVFDAAIHKAYGGKRKVAWFEVFAGEESFKRFNSWLPEETVEAFKEFLVGIKGPLTTPIGGGIRSLNVELRQQLDLFVCLRPVQYFQGVPSPVKHPEKVDMVIFRENTEDIYAGIEYAAGTAEAQKTLDFLEREFPKSFSKIRFGTKEKAEQFWAAVGAKNFPCDVRVGVGIKPVSYSGSVRLIHSAISYAIKFKRKSVTLVHKGNIMKFTEGAFRDWGYQTAKEYFDAVEIDKGPWCKIPEGKPGAGLVIKDSIADITLQQVLTRPRGRFRRHCHAQLERRLFERRSGGAGGRHRHRARRQYQLHHRPRHFRGHARHGSQVRQPGSGQSGQRGAERGNDVPAFGLGGSGRFDPQGS